MLNDKISQNDGQDDLNPNCAKSEDFPAAGASSAVKVTLNSFLAAFFPDGHESIYLRSFHPDKKKHESKKFPATSRREIVANDKLQTELNLLNKNHGIYFAVNAGGNSDFYITRFNAAFVENDELTIAEQHQRLDDAPLMPSIRIETKKSVHAYWLFAFLLTRQLPQLCAARLARIAELKISERQFDESDEGEIWNQDFADWKKTPDGVLWQSIGDEWTAIQESLIRFFDGDRSIKNPSRVMRLPFFNHVSLDSDNKPTIYKRVSIAAFEPTRRYSLEQIRTAFSSDDDNPATETDTAPNNPPNAAPHAVFDSHETRNDELKRLIAASGKRTRTGFEMKCPAHNGKGDSSLWSAHDSPAVKCQAGCDYFNILRAFGLPDEHFAKGKHDAAANYDADTDADTADLPEIVLPQLSDVALYGLAGDFVRAVLPFTEAHRAALLFQFLAVFGCLAGKLGYFHTGAKQYLNLFTLLIGKTGRQGRKGTSLENVTALFEIVDEEFFATRTLSTLASGQGLISQIADAKYKTDEHGTRQKDDNGKEILIHAGVADKRLLVRAEEFGAIMKLQGIEGSILKDTLCVAWDGKPLSNPTRHNSERCGNPHVALIGHITPFEFSALLNDVDLSNGYFNRILTAYVWRERRMPEGGAIPMNILNDFAIRTHAALAFAKQPRVFERDTAARKLWMQFYDSLDEQTEVGLIAEVLSRAESQVTRISILFAALDSSAIVRREHLEAALAVWAYSVQSINFIFRGRTGDKTADKVLETLRAAIPNGIAQSDLYGIFKNNIAKSKIEATLLMLLEAGLVKNEKQPKANGEKGRPPILWFAVNPKSNFNERNEENERIETKTEIDEKNDDSPTPNDNSLVNLVSFVKSDEANGKLFEFEKEREPKPRADAAPNPSNYPCWKCRTSVSCEDSVCPNCEQDLINDLPF